MKLVSIAVLVHAAVVLLAGVNVQAAPVTQVYGSFPAGALASGAPPIWKSENGVGASGPIGNGVPDASNLLLGFRVQLTGQPAAMTFSTGVNDAALTSNGVAFSPQVFRALPVLNAPAPATDTYVGIGSMWGGVDQWMANTAAEVPSHPERKYQYYLNDGQQGLELGTAVFNLSKLSSGYISFPLDGTKIKAEHIGDGVPDLIFTQMGDPGTSDTFGFFDGASAPGAPTAVTPAYSVNFRDTPVVGEQYWTLYKINQNPVSYPRFQNARKRNTPIVAVDYADLGVTSANAAKITELRQNLSGEADIAFIAYNESSVPVVLPVLSISKSPAAFTVPPGAQLGYNLTVQNLATNASTNGTITVTDHLPAGVGFVSANGPGWSCNYSTATGIACTTSQILNPSGSAQSIAIVLTAPAIPGPLLTVPAQVSGGGDTFCPGATRCHADATIRSVASIALTKTIDGGPATGVTGTFGFNADCGVDGLHSGSVLLSGSLSGSGGIDDIPYGATCNISESGIVPLAPPNYSWAPLPPFQVVSSVQPGSALTFTNVLTRNTTSIAITKNVSGAPASGVTGNFQFTATCDGGQSHKGSITLNASTTGVGSITGVPQGAKCDVTEDSPLPVAPASYAWGAMPAMQTVADAQPDSALTFTNVLNQDVASIAITKVVSGGPSAGVTGSFRFEANCAANGTFSGQVTLNQTTSGVGAIPGVPAGSKCTVTELSSLPTAPQGYAWGALPAQQLVNDVQSGSSSASFENKLTKTAPVAVAPIPTLGQWGMILLSTLLAGFAAFRLRRSHAIEGE